MFYKEDNENSSFVVMVEANTDTAKNVEKCSHLKIAK